MRISLRWSTVVLLVSALALVVSGCGAPVGFHLEEFALVEQSADNPTHLGFQAHVPQAVADRRALVSAAAPEQAVAVPNAALARFGHRLEPNPSAPFTGFALYQGDILVQRDIARFWPVSVQGSGADFVLAYQTLDGQRLMATLAGVQNWPGQSAQTGAAPVYYGDQIAYAETGVTDHISVMAGGGLLYAGAAGASPRNLVTWGPGAAHWALVLDDRVIQDGADLSQLRDYEEVFGWQILNGEPFYFYSRDGIVRMNYAGRDLPYAYDQVLHDQPGELAVFNPGAGGALVWFYALRDGLWYYVEAGVGG